jgi:hypothetical protein
VLHFSCDNGPARHAGRVVTLDPHQRNAGSSTPTGTFPLDSCVEVGAQCVCATGRSAIRQFGSHAETGATPSIGPASERMGEVACDSQYSEARAGNVHAGWQGGPNKAADPTKAKASYPQRAPRCRARAVVSGQRAGSRGIPSGSFGSRSCNTPRVPVQDTRLRKTRESNLLKPRRDGGALPQGTYRPGSGSADVLRSSTGIAALEPYI